jgi:hypothetical protein
MITFPISPKWPNNDHACKTFQKSYLVKFSSSSQQINWTKLQKYFEVIWALTDAYCKERKKNFWEIFILIFKGFSNNKRSKEKAEKGRKMATNWNSILQEEVRRIRKDCQQSVLVEVKDDKYDKNKIYEARLVKIVTITDVQVLNCKYNWCINVKM